MSVRPKVDIGRVVQNATVFDFKHDKATILDADSLPQTVGRLFALLDERNIAYVLVGGLALLHYVEGRNTEDIDLIMALPSLKQLPEIQVTSQDADFARGHFGELGIDILLTRNPLFEKVIRHHSATGHFVAQEIRLATVEGLLLLKLYALPSLYRQGNFPRVGLYENDIATLIQAYQPNLDSVLNELKDYLSETDLVAVRGVLVDIKHRLERFSKGPDNPA